MHVQFQLFFTSTSPKNYLNAIVVLYGNYGAIFLTTQFLGFQGANCHAIPYQVVLSSKRQKRKEDNGSD